MSRAERAIMVAAVITAVFWSFPAAASDCADSSGDVAIAACTDRINSGKFKGHDQATNYYNRGYEYDDKNDYDRAISDYSSAIKFDPKFAKAYYNRGLAYDHKGDRDRAISDYTSAIGNDPNHAKAYNNRGWLYQGKGDYDRAVADYNSAIGIDPKHAKAYNNRGLAYYHFGDYDRAISDYNSAIGSDPKYDQAYHNRGVAYEHLGDYGRAVSDLNQAISLDPKVSGAYFDRGRINLYAGSLDTALADFNQANAMSAKYAYTALWLDIVSQRNHLRSRLPQTSSQIDMTAWPAPVIGLWLGQMTAAAVLAAADNPDPARKKGQVCEANFYTGELSLLGGSRDEATRLFRLAASDCPHSFIEWSSANAELKALGATP